MFIPAATTSYCLAFSAGISWSKGTALASTLSMPMFLKAARATSGASPVTLPLGSVNPYGDSFAIPILIFLAFLAVCNVSPDDVDVQAESSTGPPRTAAPSKADRSKNLRRDHSSCSIPRHLVSIQIPWIERRWVTGTGRVERINHRPPLPERDNRRRSVAGRLQSVILANERDDPVHDVGEFVVLGREHARDATLQQHRLVVRRDDAADDDRDVAGPGRAQAVHHVRHDLEMRTGQHGKPDDVHALLHRGRDDLLGREPDALVDHLEPGVAGADGDLLGAVGMAVQPRFPDQDPQPVPQFGLGRPHPRADAFQRRI